MAARVTPRDPNKVPRAQDLRRYSLREAARRYRVSVYRVRQWRATRGIGPAPGRIRWDVLPPEQAAAVREMPRRLWGTIVGDIVNNAQHWYNTGQNNKQYKYENFEQYRQYYKGQETDWLRIAQIMKWYHLNMSMLAPGFGYPAAWRAA